MEQGVTHNNSDSQKHASKDERVYKELRLLGLFDGIPNEELWNLVKKGDLHRQNHQRDLIVSDASTATEFTAQKASGIVLVLSGQIGVGVFDRKQIAESRERQAQYEAMSEKERENESALKPPPLARIARKNIATFRVGDLFNANVLARSDLDDVVFYTLAPTNLASISHEAISNLVLKFPIMEGRLRRAIEHSRDRLHHVTGVKQELLDFFVRHGISVSGDMVRVRQLDTCIDCKLCEIACEERYGARRLTLGGYQLGMLDFVFTCRTCTDQRCIDPCDYDSIRFDKDIREVVINESSCVGCTLCAQACPYSAIEMVDVEDPLNPNHRKKFKKRLDKEGFLDFGAGKPRIAKPRRIANKCDHCMNYGDQACVSACPTGSLIEVSAYDLFQERLPAANAVAKGGFDRDVSLNHNAILPIKPFTEGLGVRDSGVAKTRRGRLLPVMFWGVSIALWFVALAEILLRIYEPTSSMEYLLLRGEGLEPVIAEMKVNFRAGSDLAIYCGWFGTGLMLIAMLYTPLRRISFFRRIASNTMWFDFHLMTGTMGPAFVILHSGVNYTTYAAGAFWSMAIVFISGVMGRYLYTQIPNLLNGRELEELDHRRALANIKKAHSNAVDVAEELLEAHKRQVDKIAKKPGLWRALAWIASEDLKRPFRWMRRRRLIKATKIPRAVAGELIDRTGRLLLVQRRRVLASHAHLILHSWKKIHVPFSILMTLLCVHHIWLELPKTL